VREEEGKLLKRFWRYLDKIFDFGEHVERRRDDRVAPQIPTPNVFRSVFLLFVLRLGSFHRLEQELKRRGRWDSLVGGRKPSADTVGYSLCRFSLDEVRGMLAHHHRTAWRGKAVHGRSVEPFRVVAVDGHELFWSEARCCSGCLVRSVQKKDRTVSQYYHRVVAAQWIGVTPSGILDVEPVKPGEGEVVAARRLLARVLEEYGRLIDVISADALYAEAPFLKDVLDAGKHFVVVLKQEARELYQDAQQLRASLKPRVGKEGSKTSQIWDLPALTTFGTLGRPVRVVWAEEHAVVPKIIGGRKHSVPVDSTWVWVTDLPETTVSAERIQRWGHDRWDIENRGFNELVQLWDLNHCFVHDPRAIEVLLLTLALAFLTTYLFFERNLKPEARRYLTRLALAQRFREDVSLAESAPSG